MSHANSERFPSVSIIIVCYNAEEFLNDCLEPLTHQAYPGDYEVILIDNASTDGSAEFVRNRFPDVTLLEPGVNLGFAKGNNLAAEAAHGSVLAFVNPDTQVSNSDWLYELVRPLVDDPSIGLTTSKIVLMDQPSKINACGLDVSLTGIATCRHFGELAGTIIDNEDVAAVSGGSFAIRTSLFQELGGFDARIWMYQEDTDLSWRARLLGYRCVLAPKSVVAHSYSFKLPPRKARDLERTRYLMLAKNLSAFSLLVLLPLLLLTEIMTWGWALLQGPKHVMAKAEATVWSLRNIRLLVRAHRETQQLRRESDVTVLRAHLSVPRVEAISDGFVARTIALIVTPIASVLAAASLWLVGIRSLRGPARWHQHAKRTRL